MAGPAEKIEACRTVKSGEPGYEEACAFTRSVFEEKLECQLEAFYPAINLLADDQAIQAVCGIRRAADERLFLEQYLELPIEHYLDGTSRDDIVEIGGFAAAYRLAALHLMGWTALDLHAGGYSHVVCTANRSIRSCLRKLGIEFAELAPASPQRLKVTANWGRYYETAPLVLAGSIDAGVKAIERFA